MALHKEFEECLRGLMVQRYWKLHYEAREAATDKRSYWEQPAYHQMQELKEMYRTLFGGDIEDGKREGG